MKPVDKAKAMRAVLAALVELAKDDWRFALALTFLEGILKGRRQ